MANFLKEVNGIARGTAMVLSDLPSIANNTILANNSGTTSTPSALTTTQVTAMLNLFTSSLQGLTPASGGGTANFLRADGTWAIPPGTGTVTSVSVTSANGFAGTVATATTTPAITISTTINSPVLAGNGTAISAATTTGTGSTVVLSVGPAITGAWTLTDAGSIINAATSTKVLAFNLSGMTAARTLTLSSSQSTTQTLTIPNITASDTLATLGLAQTFSAANTFSAAGTALTVNNNALVSGNVTVGGNLSLQELVDSTTTGSGATLNSASKSFVVLTNASLTSLSMIPAGSNGQALILTNQTGASININNQTGGTAANQITTGTAATLALANTASVELIYDNNTSKWLVVGGSGGGGSTNPTVFGTRASPLSITAGSGLVGGTNVSTTALMTISFVQGSGGAVTITASPAIASGTIVGQELQVIGRTNANPLTIPNQSGLVELNGSCTLGASDMLTLIWDGTAWVEKSRNN